jgi:hypothetical protein
MRGIPFQMKKMRTAAKASPPQTRSYAAGKRRLGVSSAALTNAFSIRTP